MKTLYSSLKGKKWKGAQGGTKIRLHRAGREIVYHYNFEEEKDVTQEFYSYIVEYKLGLQDQEFSSAA